MKFYKGITKNKTWPYGQFCKSCSTTMGVGDVYLAGRNGRDGTIAFHKECYLTLATDLFALETADWGEFPEPKFPESMYEKIRDHIISSSNPFEKRVTGV